MRRYKYASKDASNLVQIAETQLDSANQIPITNCRNCTRLKARISLALGAVRVLQANYHPPKDYSIRGAIRRGVSQSAGTDTK